MPTGITRDPSGKLVHTYPAKESTAPRTRAHIAVWVRHEATRFQPEVDVLALLVEVLALSGVRVDFREPRHWGIAPRTASELARLYIQEGAERDLARLQSEAAERAARKRAKAPVEATER